MIYQKIQWKILRKDLDFITEVLEESGIDALEILDDKEISDYYHEKQDWVIMDPVTDFGEEILITFYLPEKEIFDPPKILLDKIRQEKKDIIDDEDYLYQWQKYYEPIEIGDILVLPSWEERPTDKITIKIDPGMAFGTGDHETTKASLDFIQDTEIEGKSVLDIGTGSGILAFACDKLGAKKVCAIDIDPKAIEQAKANQKINGTHIEFHVKDLVKGMEGSFDLVLGNLLTHIIIKMLPDLPRVLKKQHEIILSGILYTELPKMKKALEKENYYIIDEKIEGEWLALKVRWNG